MLSKKKKNGIEKDESKVMPQSRNIDETEGFEEIPPLEIVFPESEDDSDLGPKSISIDYEDASVFDILSSVVIEYDLKTDLPKELKDVCSSVSLKNVTWRQIFQVVLEPVDYTYFEIEDEVIVLSKQELEAMPMKEFLFELYYIHPLKFKEICEELMDFESGEFISIDNWEVKVIASIDKHNLMKELVESIDVSYRWHFPRDVAFPEIIPKEIFNIKPLDEMSLSEKVHEFGKPPGSIMASLPDTRVLLINNVDVKLVVNRIRSIFDRDDYIQLVSDVRTNSIIITGSLEFNRKVKKLVQYLDDKKWYK